MATAKRKMTRRAFVQLAASGAGAVAAPHSAAQTVKEGQGAGIPAVFAYGYDQEPYPLDPGPHLFLDWRYITPGHVAWQLPDGREISKDPPRPGDPKIDLRTILPDPEQCPYGLRLEVQSPQKIGPVLKNDQPWEYSMGYHTLHHLDGKYRLWYETTPPVGSGATGLLCYAESSDGLHWEKPRLGIVEFMGSKQNNIVYGDPVCKHNFQACSVFLDPIAPSDERLKIIYMSQAAPEEVADYKRQNPISVSAIGEKKHLLIRCASSPDGLHWKPHAEPLLAHMSDTETTVYYDTVLRRYVGYFRMALMNRRAIGRTEATELRQWPIPEVVLWPNPQDEPSDDYYTNSKSLYPGTKTMHLMFPTIYKRRVDSTVVRLASSLDGKLWEWGPGDPVLEPGPEGSWDGGCLFAGFGLTELPGDRVALSFVGYRYPHKFPRHERLGQIGLALWPKERLVALTAEQEGEFYTQPMTLPGNTLHLNFQTRRGGYIKVEVVKKKGCRLEDCDPLWGDALKAPVSWKGNTSLGAVQGDHVTLRFRMRAAKLFSFEVI